MSADALYQKLLNESQEEIHDMADKLEKSLKDYSRMEPLLMTFATNECRMLRHRYEQHLANGFPEDKALVLVLGGK